MSVFCNHASSYLISPLIILDLENHTSTVVWHYHIVLCMSLFQGIIYYEAECIHSSFPPQRRGDCAAGAPIGMPWPAQLSSLIHTHILWSTCIKYFVIALYLLFYWSVLYMGTEQTNKTCIACLSVPGRGISPLWLLLLFILFLTLLQGKFSLLESSAMDRGSLSLFDCKAHWGNVFVISCALF